MAVYTLGITIGGGLAYMIGGAAYDFFSGLGADGTCRWWASCGPGS